MISGIAILDETLGDIRSGLLVIYGDAASGKTTLSLQYASSVLKAKGRVLFISTENELFIERIPYMVNDINLLEQFDILAIRDFRVQNLVTFNILIKPQLLERYHLLIIDSLTALYRLAFYENKRALNMLNMQFAILSKIASSIPVIATSQVRGGEEGFEILARSLVRYWADYIIKLEIIEKGIRRLTIEKPTEKYKVLDLAMTKEGLK